jgi:hypothetical protein
MESVFMSSCSLSPILRQINPIHSLTPILSSVLGYLSKMKVGLSNLSVLLYVCV